jgi:ureidoacrylate peracid hydrolase
MTVTVPGGTLYRTALERIGVANSALLIVDMQNDFCAEGGFVERLGRDVSVFPPLAGRIQPLLEAARRLGRPVIWLVARYDDNVIPRQMLTRQLEGGLDPCCATDSWGARFFVLEPRADEPVIIKHSYSGFHETELDALLRSLGVDTLIYAGVQTNVCVESTLREGHSRGYYSVIVEDCVASHMEGEHQATLNTVRFLLGDVLPSAQVIRFWEESGGVGGSQQESHG